MDLFNLIFDIIVMCSLIGTLVVGRNTISKYTNTEDYMQEYSHTVLEQQKLLALNATQINPTEILQIYYDTVIDEKVAVESFQISTVSYSKSASDYLKLKNDLLYIGSGYKYIANITATTKGTLTIRFIPQLIGG